MTMQYRGSTSCIKLNRQMSWAIKYFVMYNAVWPRLMMITEQTRLHTNLMWRNDGSMVPLIMLEALPWAMLSNVISRRLEGYAMSGKPPLQQTILIQWSGLAPQWCSGAENHTVIVYWVGTQTPTTTDLCSEFTFLNATSINKKQRCKRLQKRHAWWEAQMAVVYSWCRNSMNETSPACNWRELMRPAWLSMHLIYEVLRQQRNTLQLNRTYSENVTICNCIGHHDYVKQLCEAWALLQYSEISEISLRVLL